MKQHNAVHVTVSNNGDASLSTGHIHSVRLYNNSEAAELLKISLRTLQKLRDNGQIEFAQIGRIILYTEQQLSNFLTRNTRRAFGLQTINS